MISYDYEKILKKYLGPNKEFLENTLGEDAYSINGQKLNGDLLVIRYSLPQVIDGSVIEAIFQLTSLVEHIFEKRKYGSIHDLNMGFMSIRFFQPPSLNDIINFKAQFVELSAKIFLKSCILINTGSYNLANIGSSNRMSLEIISYIYNELSELSIFNLTTECSILLGEDYINKNKVEANLKLISNPIGINKYYIIEPFNA